MALKDEIFERCWLFIRGDMPTQEFENWVYTTSELESFFSNHLYMTLISTDYASSGPVFVLKQKLEEAVSGILERKCYCHTLPHLSDVGMGEHDQIFKSLEEKVKYGDPLWWLSLYQCNECKQCWMVGSEERINDVFIMKRVSLQESQKMISQNLWPDDFKRYDALLKIGKERGHSVRFIDPVSPSLVYTVIALALAKPGIKTQEISDLLQIGLSQAEAIISEARKQNQFIQVAL